MTLAEHLQRLIKQMTKIELTDDTEIEAFKAFRKHQSQYEAMMPAWKQVVDFTSNLGNGTFTLTVQNGLPVRINNPMQTVVIGINLTKSSY